jgi:hypothetical protein
MKALIPIIALTLFFTATHAWAQSYEFSVEHEHTIGKCGGKLAITAEMIEYKAEKEKHSRAWPYPELRQIRVGSPTTLELESYEDQKLLLGRDRTFRFKLLDGEITPEISALLTERATRPLVTSVAPVAEEDPQFEVPVKHLHNFGGCSGALKIFSDRVVYESQTRPDESRFWRYADIQNFSQSARFRFEITTFENGFGGPKAYNYQLKRELPARAYDFVWLHVYPSKFHRDERNARSGESPVRLATPQ